MSIMVNLPCVKYTSIPARLIIFHNIARQYQSLVFTILYLYSNIVRVYKFLSARLFSKG